MLDAILSATASLVWLSVMFVPLERMLPARRGQRTLRADLVTDLLFFFGQYLVFTGLSLFLVTQFAKGLSALGLLGVLGGDMFAGTPVVVQVALVLVLGDFFAYWGHRLQHNVDILWRFHAVHHTSTEVDWLAAHREHPVDAVYTQALINLPALLLGFDLKAVMGVIAFRSVWAIFIHSNVKVPLGPLKYLVGSPQLHRIHHAKDRHVGNFANLAPWIDLAFGTFRSGDEPEAMGIDDPMPRSFLGLLAAPFGYGSGEQSPEVDRVRGG